MISVLTSLSRKKVQRRNKINTLTWPNFIVNSLHQHAKRGIENSNFILSMLGAIHEWQHAILETFWNHQSSSSSRWKSKKLFKFELVFPPTAWRHLWTVPWHIFEYLVYTDCCRRSEFGHASYWASSYLVQFQYMEQPLRMTYEERFVADEFTSIMF